MLVKSVDGANGGWLKYFRMNAEKIEDYESECEIMLESLKPLFFYGKNIKMEPDIEIHRPKGNKGAAQRVEDVINVVEVEAINIKKLEEDSDFDDDSICLEDLDDLEILTTSWTRMSISRAKLAAQEFVSPLNLLYETVPSLNNKPTSLKTSSFHFEIGRDCKFLQIVNDFPDSMTMSLMDDVNTPENSQCRPMKNVTSQNQLKIKCIPRDLLKAFLTELPVEKITNLKDDDTSEM